MTVTHSLDTVFYIAILVLIAMFFVSLFNSDNWGKYKYKQAFRFLFVVVNIAMLALSLPRLFEWLGWFS